MRSWVVKTLNVAALKGAVAAETAVAMTAANAPVVALLQSNLNATLYVR